MDEADIKYNEWVKAVHEFLTQSAGTTYQYKLLRICSELPAAIPNLKDNAKYINYINAEFNV